LFPSVGIVSRGAGEADDMRNIARWLAEIERMARDLYQEAAVAIKDDEKLSAFLEGLAREESTHADTMLSAAERLDGKAGLRSPVALDDTTKDNIERPFVRLRQCLSSGKPDAETALDCITEAEFSEWNNFFLFVVNSLKEEGPEFMKAVSEMQGHLRKVRDFVEARPGAGARLASIDVLPEVWTNRILVVDDRGAIRDLLSFVLKDVGAVDTAENGREALEKAAECHYDVIISDINMPIMGGMELYRQALKGDPEVGSRFLFFSVMPRGEQMDFLEKNGLRYLAKPASLKDIERSVREVLYGSTGRSLT
jgi:CheY-like chemotaxis protein